MVIYAKLLIVLRRVWHSVVGGRVCDQYIARCWRWLSWTNPTQQIVWIGQRSYLMNTRLSFIGAGGWWQPVGITCVHVSVTHSGKIEPLRLPMREPQLWLLPFLPFHVRFACPAVLLHLLILSFPTHHLNPLPFHFPFYISLRSGLPFSSISSSIL